MKSDYSYLPNETPSLGRLIIYSFQQVIVMFPATITVALITGFSVSTTLFSCGLATICCTLITKKKLPLFYGASFAYMSAIIGLVNSLGFQMKDGILPIEAIRVAQFGIISSGFVSISAGILIHFLGNKFVDKILPPHVTGSVSILVGLSLASNAISDAAPDANQPQIIWLVSIVTFLAMVIAATKFQGVLKQLPLLFGVLAGCVVSLMIYYLSNKDINLFRSMPDEVFARSIWKFGKGNIISLPAFSLPKLSLSAVIAIMPMAIATIPESVSHVFQIDVYINNLARLKRKKELKIKNMLDLNLIGDGFGDIIAGLIGGPAGTSYGENISVMTISNVFSISVLLCAAVMVMVLSCFTPLIKLVYFIPIEVIGGLEIYMFGAISVQGIAIMIENNTDVFNIKTVSTISTILLVGLGGTFYFNGVIPFMGFNVPAIAGASAIGILLNSFLNIIASS